MAEKTYVFPNGAAVLTFLDGAAAAVGSPTNCKVTSIPVGLPRVQEDLFLPDHTNGRNELYQAGIDNGFQELPVIEVETHWRDPSNVTDITTHEIFDALYEGSNVGTPLSANTTTNSGVAVDNRRYMLDARLTFNDAAAVSTDQTYTGAVYCSQRPSMAPLGEHMGGTYQLKLCEEWTKA